MEFKLLLKYECFTETTVEADSFDEAVRQAYNKYNTKAPEYNEGICSIFDQDSDGEWML